MRKKTIGHDIAEAAFYIICGMGIGLMFTFYVDLKIERKHRNEHQNPTRVNYISQNVEAVNVNKGRRVLDDVYAYTDALNEGWVNCGTNRYGLTTFSNETTHAVWAVEVVGGRLHCTRTN